MPTLGHRTKPGTNIQIRIEWFIKRNEWYEFFLRVKFSSRILKANHHFHFFLMWLYGNLREPNSNLIWAWKWFLEKKKSYWHFHVKFSTGLRQFKKRHSRFWFLKTQFIFEFFLTIKTCLYLDRRWSISPPKSRLRQESASSFCSPRITCGGRLIVDNRV